MRAVATHLSLRRTPSIPPVFSSIRSTRRLCQRYARAAERVCVGSRRLIFMYHHLRVLLMAFFCNTS